MYKDLTKDDYNFIKENIYILDMTSLKNICNKLNLEYNIFIEKEDYIKKTSETLHKEFIIKNILNKVFFDKTTKVVYSSKIQNYNNTNNIKATDCVYYGQYKTTDKNIFKLLKVLTNDKFYFGAISQKIIKTYWKKNKLITYKEFAKIWLKEAETQEIKYKELAYNQFMKTNGSKLQWKKLKKEVINKFRDYKLL